MSDEQRRLIDELRRREGKTLAQVVRDALDAYLSQAGADSGEALSRSFGVAPKFGIPERNEWQKRERTRRG
jgi:hypothetical protein